MKALGGTVGTPDSALARGRMGVVIKGSYAGAVTSSSSRNSSDTLFDNCREWLNGMAHGKGVETNPDGDVRHDGQWFEDEPVSETHG